MKQYPFERPIVAEIQKGLDRKKKLLHVITGPRQVGKTTAALQIAGRWNGVDFVVKTTKQLWGIKLKSGNTMRAKGVSSFLDKYPEARPLIVGQEGISLETFFRTDPKELFC